MADEFYFSNGLLLLIFSLFHFLFESLVIYQVDTKLEVFKCLRIQTGETLWKKILQKKIKIVLIQVSYCLQKIAFCFKFMYIWNEKFISKLQILKLKDDIQQNSKAQFTQIQWNPCQWMPFIHTKISKQKIKSTPKIIASHQWTS